MLVASIQAGEGEGSNATLNVGDAVGRLGGGFVGPGVAGTLVAVGGAVGNDVGVGDKVGPGEDVGDEVGVGDAVGDADGDGVGVVVTSGN